MSGIPAIGTVRTLPTDDEARAWRAKLDAAIRRAYEDQMEAFRRAYEDFDWHRAPSLPTLGARAVRAACTGYNQL